MRLASDDLQLSFYTLNGDRVTIQLTAPMTDDGINAAPRGPVEESLEFTWRKAGETLELSPADGTAFELSPSKLGTTPLDRQFT